MVRPQGKHYKQYKVHLLPRQIKWLQSEYCNNSSQLIRQLIDMDLQKSLNTLSNQLNTREEKVKQLNDECQQLIEKKDKDSPDLLDIQRRITGTTAEIAQLKPQVQLLKECLQCYG
jgi:chromosome segregation ATPase